MVNKNRVVIDRRGVIDVLTSEFMSEALEEVANEIVNSDRYKIERSGTNSKRAVVNIIDDNADAIQYEMKTNNMQKISRKKL